MSYCSVLVHAKLLSFQGAAILRMLSEFLTESIFAKGLHVCLKGF